MATAASYKGVLKRYQESTPEVQWYFSQIPLLLPAFPYEVTLAYLFLRTEKAHNRALYCGVVKLHRAHTEIADRAVNTHHLTRDGFLDLYKNVFGHALSPATVAKIKDAEKIRDRVIHGKDVTDQDLRQALVDVIVYAEALNTDVHAMAGFKPFGDLRGFKGRAEPLDKSTTRWLLKGIGFAIA